MKHGEWMSHFCKWRGMEITFFNVMMWISLSYMQICISFGYAYPPSTGGRGNCWCQEPFVSPPPPRFSQWCCLPPSELAINEGGECPLTVWLHRRHGPTSDVLPRLDPTIALSVSLDVVSWSASSPPSQRWRRDQCRFGWRRGRTPLGE
jgi:hypothetical protein